MDRMKRIICDASRIVIRSFGYNFGFTDVYGRELGKVCRSSGATSLFFRGGMPEYDMPISNGEIWNVLYNPTAPIGILLNTDNGEFWERCKWFLE